MKRFVLLAVIIFTGLAGRCQVFKPEDAAKHIGDSITICGKIFGGKFLENAKNQPTFLNMGAAFPNQTFTVVIWGDMRKKLAYSPEEKLKDKEICIIGRVEEFKGNPQIVLLDESQLKIQ
jgi:hypothetical protein